jgi:hypothetical protein
MWTLAFWHHEDRTPTHGYAATRQIDWKFAQVGTRDVKPGAERSTSRKVKNWKRVRRAGT